MNIAIMVCEKVTHFCSGVGCFKVFNNKDKAFEIYKNKEDINLYGFFHCGGCKSNLNNENLDYKINQLKNLNVIRVHMAKCIEVECYRYDEIKRFLLYKGFEVIEGTH